MRSRFDRVEWTWLLVVAVGALLMPTPLAQRRTPTIPPDLRPWKDFDVVPTSGYDAAGFLLNPKWGKQIRQNTLPSPTDSCPVDDFTASHWTSSTQWPNCTSTQVSFNTGTWCSGHANFVPITYDGRVSWNGTGEFPANWWPAGDSDYTLNLERDDEALYSTAGHLVHLEFDSRETVDLWDNTDTWWEKFHRSVDEGDQHAHDSIDNHRAIVTGMLGMDTYQGIGHATSSHGKSELHPVYAMFVLVEQDQRAKTARWAFFVRNWGNEGYCGERQVWLYQQLFSVRLPNAVAILSPSVWHGARNSDDLSAMRVTVSKNADGGVELGFNLLSPERQSWFMGDLLVQQRSPVDELPRLQGAPPVTADEPEERSLPRFAEVRAEINKLPEASRKDLVMRQRNAVVRKPGSRISLVTVTEPSPGRGNALPASPPAKVIRLGTDTIGDLNRSRQLDVLRQFLAEKGIRITVPREP